MSGYKLLPYAVLHISNFICRAYTGITVKFRKKQRVGVKAVFIANKHINTVGRADFIRRIP